MRIEIHALGDAALIVGTPDRAALAWLESAAIPGVREVVRAATSATLFYSAEESIAAGAPEEGVVDWLAERVHGHLKAMPPSAEQAASRWIRIPVCYEYGADLRAVAGRLGLAVEEIAALHHGAEHAVVQLGFAPGFPYLDGLPGMLALPRLETPRTSVPAGSVGIANGQTCIYPVSVPGGWNLIGRTPLRLFRPEQEPPVLLQVGDQVTFFPITAAEFKEWEEEA